MFRSGIAWPAVRCSLFVLACLATHAPPVAAQSPRFHVLALAEHGGVHRPFVDAAKVWLAKEAAAVGFDVEYIENTDRIDDQFLSRFRLFIQLNYPPYGWKPTAAAAVERHIDRKSAGQGKRVEFRRCSSDLEYRSDRRSVPLPLPPLHPAQLSSVRLEANGCSGLRALYRAGPRRLDRVPSRHAARRIRRVLDLALVPPLHGLHPLEGLHSQVRHGHRQGGRCGPPDPSGTSGRVPYRGRGVVHFRPLAAPERTRARQRGRKDGAALDTQ